MDQNKNFDSLSKELKKTVLIFLFIVIFLIIIYIVNLKTDIFLKLTEKFLS